MSEFFYVLIYVMQLHHGLDYGVVVNEPFATLEDCTEAFEVMRGLAPGEAGRIARGELEVAGACLQIKRT